VERSDIRFEGYASPVIYGPQGQPAQVIVLGAHRIDAYAVATGERLWWVRGLGYFPIGSPVLGKGVVVVSTYGSDTPMGPAYEDLLKKLDTNGDGRVSREECRADKEIGDQFGAMDFNNDGFLDRDEWELLRNGAVGDYGLVAVRLGGRGDLTQTSVAWREKKTYPNITSPLIYKDVLYVIKTGGIIGSMDPLNGQIFKVERAKDAMEEYYSSPVAADGKVIFTNEAGKVAVLKAGEQWEILAVNDLGEECYATPAIAGGKIFIRTRSALYCFGKK
jgi:outer membrane protein assembly factor BamB